MKKIAMWIGVQDFRRVKACGVHIHLHCNIVDNKYALFQLRNPPNLLHSPFVTRMPKLSILVCAIHVLKFLNYLLKIITTCKYQPMETTKWQDTIETAGQDCSRNHDMFVFPQLHTY